MNEIGGRGASSGKRTSEGGSKGDIVYKSQKETEEEVRNRAQRSGSFTMSQRVNDEGLRAIAELPNGGEFTVHHVGFGVGWYTERFVMNKNEFNGKRTISRISEDGRHSRGKAVNTISQLKKEIGLGTAERIVIHNRGKSLIPKKTKRQEEAEWKELVRNMEKYRAK